MFKEREEFTSRLEELKKIKVFKYGRFMQAMMYLLGFSKDQVVEPGTQKFHWKTAKTLLNEDFIEKMANYEIMGPKEEAYAKYQTLNYIEKIIDGIEQAQVDEFNMAAGRLFRWLKLAIENRKLDIVRRKALILKEREERDSKIKAKEDREKKMEAELEEAKQKFLEEHKDEIDAYEAYKKAQEGGGDDYGDEDEEEEEEAKNKEPPTLPVFNQEEFLEAWTQENPEIVIQDSTKDDIDNDWILSEEEQEDQIKAFWAARAES